MLGGDLVYGVHVRMINRILAQPRVNHCCGMGLLKLAVGCFCFIPWVSIRMVLNRPTQQSLPGRALVVVPRRHGPAFVEQMADGE